MEGYHLRGGCGDESNDWLFVNSRAPGTNYDSFSYTGACLILKYSMFLFTVLLVVASDTLWLELVVLFWFILGGGWCIFVPLCESKIGLCCPEKVQAHNCHMRWTLLSPVWNKTIPVRRLYLDEPSVALACWALRTSSSLSRQNYDLFISCCVLTLL